ncbi:MAG: NAD(P)/FAD-dependent oxidoreductase [Ardenticatenaceae bacterium]|nr:NAD(P)/FAD-dependent oxidoreductase [Anaerolineales bacterium]MCB8923191.1 NAD(P)/FAD-dependent oxidoreductase [Ardenticatenaceae bacterium]MCB9004864.1 NAD(P)/FAD-dependent oxidoreductase [Ardenticatenaceae bacterium]
MTHYLIIGNGAAGVTAAETIRVHDPQARIVLVSAEPGPMYSRPGLAYVLMQEIPPQQIHARQPEWYAQFGLELVHGTAVSLDVVQQKVGLADGRKLFYDKLLIATGARAVSPPYPGIDLKGVVYLDTLAGTQDLLKQTRRARRAVVIGGGITALELSEGLAHQGVDTHYFVRRDRLWGRVFNDAEAKILEERIIEHGITIHYHTEIQEILGNWRGHVRGVVLKDGSEFKCDLVGIAVGVKPHIEVVQNTALQVDRAILVNEYLQSSVPNIYAAGDCAQVYDRWTQKHMLDILWPSAVAEGRAAALNMMGQRVAYTKGSPFNACLLFGLHITTMGQVNPHPDETPEIVQYLSRGSSEVWYTYPRTYNSAWSESGPNTLRLVINDGYLVGALLMGSQRLADPLRHLIENEVYIGDWKEALEAGGELLQKQISDYWQAITQQQTVSTTHSLQ